MTDKKVNFIVGLVVIVALGILVFGVYFLKDQKFGEKKDFYYVVFNRVSTLTVNDPVKLNGVTMGRVKAIELWKNKVRVTFFVKQFFVNQDGTKEKIRIPINSDVIVQNIGLMGERQIEIHLGDAPEAYAPGSIIENGRFDAGIAEAMGTAGKVFEDAEAFVQSVQSLFDSTVGQEEFTELFNSVLTNTKMVTEKMNRMLNEIDPRIKSSLSNLERASLEIDKLVNSESGPVKELLENGNTVSHKVKDLMEKVELITTEVSTIMNKVNSNEGTLGALIHDTSFHADLLSTVRNADSLLSIIRRKGLDVNVDIF